MSISGIYKITNVINNHSYIGQSVDIKRRWRRHKSDAYKRDYPLHRAIRKYGIENFIFEILEECEVTELDNKEIYWINKIQPEYNVASGGSHGGHSIKLSKEQVEEIQQILINDPEGNLSHYYIAEKYDVSVETIRHINIGQTWKRDDLKYPLHPNNYFKYYDENGKVILQPMSVPKYKKVKRRKYYCEKCGKEISRHAKVCKKCAALGREKKRKEIRPTREQLKQDIRNNSFVDVGKKYGVTDNGIRRWCDAYNLPRRKKDIEQYSDEEWKNV